MWTHAGHVPDRIPDLRTGGQPALAHSRRPPRRCASPGSAEPSCSTADRLRELAAETAAVQVNAVGFRQRAPWTGWSGDWGFHSTGRPNTAARWPRSGPTLPAVSAAAEDADYPHRGVPDYPTGPRVARGDGAAGLAEAGAAMRFPPVLHPVLLLSDRGDPVAALARRCYAYRSAGWPRKALWRWAGVSLVPRRCWCWPVRDRCS